MFKKIDWFLTLLTGSIAGILFSVPVLFFIRDATYTESWLLYVGSALFLLTMVVYTWIDNKNRGENESTAALVFATHVTTVVGVTVACIVCFILLVILVPGYLGSGNTEKFLTDGPPTSILDKTNGLSLKVFASATILNFAAGSFVGIVYPFASKKNQTEDSREPTPFHQKGKK
jgi:uncharacterized membrane protein